MSALHPNGVRTPSNEKPKVGNVKQSLNKWAQVINPIPLGKKKQKPLIGNLYGMFQLIIGLNWLTNIPINVIDIIFC